MNKIVSITTVKNEADIIESFVRYHLNIVDLMIILNNGSTDDTIFILNKLIEENLPIVVINDEDRYFEPMEKYNFLLKKAVNDYDADIICPLDVDEFLTSDNGNPRDIIQNMPPFTFYKIKWRTYVPSQDDDNNQKFIPSRITNIRDENVETFYKVVLTRDLSYHYNARLSTGNHNLNVQDRFKNDVNCEIRFDLKIAHFPLRSIEQMTSKVLVSYPNVLSRKNVNPNMSHHYPLMFNKYLKEGAIEINDVAEFAKQYSLEENKGNVELKYRDIEVTQHPLNLDFCENIDIKYDFVLNPFKNVLENYVYFAGEIHNFKKDKELSANMINDIKEEKEDVQTKFKEKIILIGDKDRDIRILNSKISQFEENMEHYNLEICDLKNLNNKMKNTISDLNEEINSLNESNNSKDKEINSLNESNNSKDKEIDVLNNLFAEKTEQLENFKNTYESEINDLKNSNDEMKKTITNLNIEKAILKDNNKESINTINHLKNKLSDSRKLLLHNTKKLKDNNSELNCLRAENDFLIKHNKLSKKITSKFSYLYLIFKSKPKNRILDIKLFKVLKKSEIFDVGFYLSNYPDLVDSKICDYFSPELHYVCYGFYEDRLINYNFSKIEEKEFLLNMIYNDGDL